MKATVCAILCLVATFAIGMVHSAPPYKFTAWSELLPAKLIEKEAAAPIYKNCGAAGDKFKVNDVKIAGCTTPPCILKKGSNVSVEIDFTASEVTPNVTADVYGVIAGVKVPFPLPNKNACKTGVSCPTASGASYPYKNNLFIESSYPDLELVVLWYLKDAKGQEGLCIDVLVQIQ